MVPAEKGYCKDFSPCRTPIAATVAVPTNSTPRRASKVTGTTTTGPVTTTSRPAAAAARMSSTSRPASKATRTADDTLRTRWRTSGPPAIPTLLISPSPRNLVARYRPHCANIGARPLALARPWEDTMKFSACIEWLFAEESDDFARRIQLARQAGLDAVEFWRWTNKDIDAIERALGETGMALSGFVAEPMIALTDAANRQTFLD